MLDIDALVKNLIDKNGSDIYLTVGAVPHLRTENGVEKTGAQVLTDEDIRHVIVTMVNEQGVAEFDSSLEYNTTIDWKGKTRLRLNLFRQRQHSGLVIHCIRSDIPSLEALNLAPLYASLALEKRGLILITGHSGSGKSTTIAAMLNHRNHHGQGHILTIENPVEFVHEHKNCIFTHRDVGIDTASFAAGLKSAWRQMPDVIVIGEINDAETMEQAIQFAETGHLCIATIHSNNTVQSIEHILTLFPQPKHKQILKDLSANLKAILSQRLVPNLYKKKSLAVEIMLNQEVTRNLIAEGRFEEIKEAIEKNHGQGMQSLEQSMIELFSTGIISEEIALAEADNPANLRIAMRQLTGLRKPKGLDELQSVLLEAEKKHTF